MEYYELKVAGLTRQLPLCPVSEHLDIAAFVMFSDVELTVACAKALLEKVPDFDILVTAESKGIPLAYEMARQSGREYLLARKGKKVYMLDPQEVTVKSITTAEMQHLYIGKADLERMSGKRILLVDDVVSTGKSMDALLHLVKLGQGTIVGQAAVLAEGEAAEREDLIFLEKLPVFPK